MIEIEVEIDLSIGIDVEVEIDKPLIQLIDAKPTFNTANDPLPDTSPVDPTRYTIGDALVTLKSPDLSTIKAVSVASGVPTDVAVSAANVDIELQDTAGSQIDLVSQLVNAEDSVVSVVVAPDGTVNYEIKFDDEDPIEVGVVVVKSNSSESLLVIVPKPLGSDGTARLTDSDLGFLFDTAIPCGTLVSIAAPDGTININLKDTSGTAIGAPISPVDVLSGGATSVDVQAPDAIAQLTNSVGTPLGNTNIKSGSSAPVVAPNGTFLLSDGDGVTLSTTEVAAGRSTTVNAPIASVNLQKQDSTPANIGTVIPVTAKSGETKSVNVPVADSILNVQLKDTAGTNLGAATPVNIKAESTAAQNITAPDGRAIDSNGVFEDIKSGDVELLSNVPILHSDSTPFYEEPRFLTSFTLPKIRLDIGLDTYLYETTDFTNAGPPFTLIKDISDIAGAPVKSGIKYQDWAFYVNRPSYFDGDIRWQIDRGDFDRLPEPSNPTHEARLADPSNPFVLADNNEFGNTSRWTDPSGGQAFTEYTWNKDHLLGVEFQCRGVNTAGRLNPAERRDFCIANGGFVMPMFLLIRMHAGYWTYRWTQNNPAIVAILGNGNLVIPTTDPNQNTAGGTPTTYYMGWSANYQQSYYVTNESIASSSKRPWIWCRRFNTL